MTDILGRLTDPGPTADDYLPSARSLSAGRDGQFKVKLQDMKATPTGGSADTIANWLAILQTINAALPAGGDAAVISGATGHVMQSAERTFTETAGAGTYTGSVSLPAGATIHDIIINGVALWTNTGTATMKVGDTDDDGFYIDIDLKATDLLAGESLSFALAGGKAGAYIANSQVSPRYSASARTISGIITTSSTGGGAGRTRMTVIWSAPAAGYIVAATKA